MYADLGPGHVAELEPPSSDGVDVLYSHEYVARRMRRRRASPMRSRNLYSYVDNNPPNHVDPLGLEAIPLTIPGKCNDAITIPEKPASSILADSILVGNAQVKCRMLRQYGQVPLGKPIDRKARGVTVSLEAPGSNAYFCGSPRAGQYYCAAGMKPSIGFIVLMPWEDTGPTYGFNVLVVHVSGAADIAEFMHKYDFPRGSHGIICGGSNCGEPGENNSSNKLLHWVELAFIQNHIKIDGMVDYDGCCVDASGKYAVTIIYKRSPNTPECK